MNRRSIFKSIAAALIAPKAVSALPASQSISGGFHKFDPAKWDGAEFGPVKWVNPPDSYTRKISSPWEDKY